MALIELERVGHVYDAGLGSSRRALQGISIRIAPGERIALLGPSGCGKSTLSEILAGVLSPNEGRVRYHSPNGGVTTPVRLLFQFPEVQLFAPTVLDDVAFGPRNAGRDDARARAREALALCRVGEALHDRPPWSLSDGERRRVALAGLLALEPELLILDEPEVGLDRDGRDRLEEILTELWGRGTGVIVATHDADLAARVSRRALLLEEGRLTYDGAWAALLAEPDRLRRAGVEPPGTALLLAELARRGWPVRVDQVAVEAAAEEIAAAARRMRGEASPSRPRKGERADG